MTALGDVPDALRRVRVFLNIIYTGAALNQNSAQRADYMTRHFVVRAYLVGSDHVYPYESNHEFWRTTDRHGSAAPVRGVRMQPFTFEQVPIADRHP